MDITDKPHYFHMDMITQDNEAVQRQEFAERVFSGIPSVISSDPSRIYVLVKDLPESTEEFILNARFSDPVIRVIPEESEKSIVEAWRKHGFKCVFCGQSMEYMHHDVTIRYLIVTNPRTELCIALIPWFMLPRRKHPVTVHAYANWYHRTKEGKSGLRTTAAVARKMFGLDKFDRTAVSRAVGRGSGLCGEERKDALPTDEPNVASLSDIVDWVTDALEKPARAGAAGNAGRDSAAMHSGQPGQKTMGNIPPEFSEFSEVTKPKAAAAAKRGSRRAPVRRGNNRKPPKKQAVIDFIAPHLLERMRIEFTKLCKNIVLDAAIMYKRFII